jgi:hypothetical protein
LLIENGWVPQRHSAHYIWCRYAYQPTTGSVCPKSRNENGIADFITQKG